LAWFPLCAASLGAQEPDSVLADRVRRLEAVVAILQQQLAEQAGQAVTSRSGLQLQLTGTVLVNAFFNNAKVNTSETPQVVVPPDPPGGLPVPHVGATARQTRIALLATHPDVLGAAFTGEVDLDFFGGQLAGSRYFPLARLRRLRADLAWTNAWIMVGQEAPPILELNPSSLAADGLPEFTLAGNLWLWLPQVRAGLGAGDRVRVGLEVAAIAPTDGSAQGMFLTQPDRAERTGRPFVQGRTLVRWMGNSEGEISLGGHYGWIAVSEDSSLISSAVAGSARMRFGRFLELRGEAFAGQALGVLGGGGAGQTLGPGDLPVRTRGGWVQVNLMPAPAWEWGGGIGFDDPDDADVDPAAGRLHNRTWEAHIHWRPAPVVVGLTFRRILTDYPIPVGRRLANHINIAAGFRF
jgi:hypothetical protein